MQCQLHVAARAICRQGLGRLALLALPSSSSGSVAMATRLQQWQQIAHHRNSSHRGRGRSSVRASWGLGNPERKTERGGDGFQQGGRDAGPRQEGRGGGWWGERKEENGRRGGQQGGSRTGGRFARGGREGQERNERGGQWGRGGAAGGGGWWKGGGRGEREESVGDWEEEERDHGEERGGGAWGGSEGRGGRGGRGSWGGRGGPAEQRNLAPKAPTIRDQWVGDYVYGVAPVLAALKAGRREVTALYLQEGMQLAKRKDKGSILAVKAMAQEGGITVVEASKHDLNLITDNRPHQGLVLDCAPLEFEMLNSFPEPPAGGREASGAVPLWLCLDEVMDPQNFGAALRSAFFLGVSGVLTCHRNSAPLSAVVSKASSGAMELMAVHACKSLPQTMADAKRKGWRVLGAAAEEGAVPCTSLSLDTPTILVLGNEGYGVRPTVKRLCDATLQIQGNGCGGGGWGDGTAELVDSLNVSVATGILLHQLINSAPPASES